MKSFTIISLFALFVAAGSLMSCSQKSPNQALSDINSLIVDGQLDQALKECTRLSETDSLSTPQLLQLALAYAQIADGTDRLEDMAMAALCYNRAMTTDPAGTEDFMLQLPAEQCSQLRMLAALDYDSDLDSDPDFDSDSDSDSDPDFDSDFDSDSDFDL